MKRYLRKILVLCALAAVICLLGGCQFTASVDELLTLPQLSLEYEGLSQQIDNLLTQGYEYASPTSGRNIQSVQMVDLNGDGSEEAIAFFRRSTDEKPLKIVVFSTEEGNYNQLCTLESSGTEVESVTYQDLTGDDTKEMIIGWKMGADGQTVAVYDVHEKPAALMRSNYVRFTVQTLDGDNSADLVVLRSNEEGNSVAELYSYDNGSMEVRSSCALSSTMADLNRGSIAVGKLNEKTTALYITGVNDQTMAVTDILACEKGILTNIVENRGTGMSDVVYPYHQLMPQDIDGDGAIEIPIYQQDVSAAETDGIVSWQRYHADGRATWVLDTCHCLSAGWYLTLEADWHDRVTMSADDTGTSGSRVAIYVDGDIVAALYTISGENQESWAVRGNRFVLKRQTAVTYAGEVFSDSEVYDMNESNLRKNFNLIMDTWTTVDN